MGAGQEKGKEGSKTAYEQADDSSFFKKQMVTYSKILNIEEKLKFEQQIGQGTYASVFKGLSVRSGCPRCIKKVEKSKAPGIEQTLMNEFDVLRDLVLEL
jgi:hypothetical protein